MNTIRSTWGGWGALCLAGGGAYYFAKRSINADRLSRFEETQKRKDQAAKAEANAKPAHKITTPPIPVPPTPSPSSATATRSPSAAVEGGGGGGLSAQHSKRGVEADDVGSPSEEIGHDPAPTRHEPDTEAQRVAEKGKYEAAEQFRPRKGNRFN